MSELAVIEIKPEQAPALYVANGLDTYLEQIRQAVNEVPDLSTKKGRDRVASLAAQVSRSKTAIEKPGREYLKHLKEQPKIVEAELRRFVTECDNLRDATRKPLTDWEVEQARIKAEEEMNALHAEALVINENIDLQRAIQYEADHELALLMNDAFNREQAVKAAEAERHRIAHEEEIKRQAAEKAKREAEEKAAAELAAIKQREADAIAAKAQAELLAKQAEERAEQQRQEALVKAEREKQAAIEEERQKAVAAEAARRAEVKRIAEEEAQRIANIEHCRAINQRAVADLVKSGVPEDCAKKCVAAIAKSMVSNITIKY
ncbi:hypothetical protein ACVG9K_000518 [Klebsiella oxytoca]